MHEQRIRTHSPQDCNTTTAYLMFPCTSLCSSRYQRALAREVAASTKSTCCISSLFNRRYSVNEPAKTCVFLIDKSTKILTSPAHKVVQGYSLEHMLLLNVLILPAITVPGASQNPRITVGLILQTLVRIFT